MVAETVIFFDAKRAGIYPAFTADEARLVSMANAEAIVASSKTKIGEREAELLAMVKKLRDSAVNTPALDSSEEWTALIVDADAVIAKWEGRSQ